MASGVNTESLRGSASQVKSIAGNFRAELTRLETLVKTTAGEWQGPAKDAFEATYEKYRQNMTNFIESLENYSGAMNAFADDQDAIENAGKNRFNSI